MRIILSIFVSLFCIFLVPVSGNTQTIQASVSQRRYLSSHIYLAVNHLVFSGSNGQINMPLENWQVSGTPVGRLIPLTRPASGGTEIKILDSSGLQIGGSFVAQGYVGIVTDKNIITLPETLHNPLRNHDLGFYTLQGVLLKQAIDPDLKIAKWWPEANGQIITVNRGPTEGQRTIVVYDADGQVLWRYPWLDNEYPDVTMTPDGKRLVLVKRNLTAGTAILSVIAPGNQILKKHQLPNLYKMIASFNSERIAAVGQEVVILIDAKSGNLVWRQDESVDLVTPGGLVFSPDSQDLFVLAANRDRRAGRSHLRFFRFSVADGAEFRTDLEDIPLDKIPELVGVEMAPGGKRQVILHDRVLQVPGPAGRTP